VYLVLDDFGTIGRAYREVDETQTDRETAIRNLPSGEYNNPVRWCASILHRDCRASECL
jgi:hypothetical protein